MSHEDFDHAHYEHRLQWIGNPLIHLWPELKYHHDVERRQTMAARRKSIMELEIEEAHEMERATPSELFYDLFFVGNLTIITGVHHINTQENLASYVFFFIILWFSWLHTTLFDVRFSADSVWERGCKGMHFAIMVGFGSVSTLWEPFATDDKDTKSAIRNIAIALMVSRFVLSIQYAVVAIFAKRYNKPLFPLIVHSASMAAAALCYMELYILYKEERATRLYIFWYIVMAFETLIVVVSSSIWSIVSFSRTHLVERMGLLTLIIMGEGIIVMLKAVNTIVKNIGWDAAVAGIVISGVTIIYLHYMFYFDYNPMHAHYSSVRQQTWTLLHFPYHLAMVLSVEGLNQFTTFYCFLSGVIKLEDNIFKNQEDVHSVTEWLREMFGDWYSEGRSETVLREYDRILKDLDILEHSDPEHRTEETNSIIRWMSSEVFIAYSEFVGLEVDDDKFEDMAKAKGVNETTIKLQVVDPFDQVFDLYELIFVYFFTALAVTFLMYAAFAWIVRRRRHRYDFIFIGLRGIWAVVLAAMLAIRGDWSRYDHYLGSPWIVPSVCMLLLTVLVVDKTLGAHVHSRHKAGIRARMRGGSIRGVREGPRQRGRGVGRKMSVGGRRISVVA